MDDRFLDGVYDPPPPGVRPAKRQPLFQDGNRYVTADEIAAFVSKQFPDATKKPRRVAVTVTAACDACGAAHERTPKSFMLAVSPTDVLLICDGCFSGSSNDEELIGACRERAAMRGEQ